MVLWEITLGTAYFLGLRRTYRLALKIQRKLISPKHPKIRQFVHRRTRTVFDVALKVHRNIQERDFEVGRNLGNWILRWLDRMKPSAQIRGHLPEKPTSGASSNMNVIKQSTSTSRLKTPGTIQTSTNKESDKHLFTSARNMWSNPFPSMALMMRPPRPSGGFTQYRHLSMQAHTVPIPNYNIGGAKGLGVLRKDIMHYLLQN